MELLAGTTRTINQESRGAPEQPVDRRHFQSSRHDVVDFRNWSSSLHPHPKKPGFTRRSGLAAAAVAHHRSVHLAWEFVWEEPSAYPFQRRAVADLAGAGGADSGAGGALGCDSVSGQGVQR